MEQISVTTLRERLSGNDEPVLVDVREPHEREEFNIGGLHIPLGRIMGMQADELEDKQDEEIIVYCRSGQRSMQAALMLETMGFKNVKNLEGGMNAWQAL